MHFPLKLLPENASHSERSFRDTASACGPVGKVHPALRARSEMQFPLEARSGNGIPLWGRNLGRSFRLRAGSGKRVPFRAAIPGHSFRRYKATVRRPYHMPSNMRFRNTKQQIECSFSKKFTSRNLPRLHIQLPFTVADYRPPIQTRNLSPKAGHLPAWLDFGQLLVS